jgi:hypothetical protein
MYFRTLAFAALAAAVVGVAGCQTMSAEECAAADWRALGYEDAAQRGADRLLKRGEDCAKTGVSADAEAYQSGFAMGMREFCIPERGFVFARRGGVFEGACPADLEAEFRPAYLDGVRVRQAESALQTAQVRVSVLENQRARIDRETGEAESALSQATTKEERDRLTNQINGLRRDRRRTSDDLAYARSRVPVLEDAVLRLRDEIGDRWGPW